MSQECCGRCPEKHLLSCLREPEGEIGKASRDSSVLNHSIA